MATVRAAGNGWWVGPPNLNPPQGRSTKLPRRTPPGRHVLHRANYIYFGWGVAQAGCTVENQANSTVWAHFHSCERFAMHRR